jgi:HEPN domain-containing protein
MSLDKKRYEAERWLETAKEDLDAAEALSDKEKYSHSCFFAQQSGEKALKALWIFLGEDPWGHSIQKLMSELPDPEMQRRLAELLEVSAVLDRYYIPTRYPNGLPDLTPGKVYFQKDASTCIGAAHRLLERVKECMGTS